MTNFRVKKAVKSSKLFTLRHFSRVLGQFMVLQKGMVSNLLNSLESLVATLPFIPSYDYKHFFTDELSDCLPDFKS